MLAMIYLVGFGGSEPDSALSQQPKPSERRVAPRERQPSQPAPVVRPSPIHDEPAAEPDDRSSDPPPSAAGEQDQLRRSLQHEFGRSSDSRQRAHEAPAPESSLPEEYVASILREQLMPLAQLCYEDIALGSSGTAKFSVALIGDAEVGGIVDWIDVNDVDKAIQGDLVECVRQSAYAMKFDPPADGQGVTEVDFSIRFSSEPPEQKSK